MLLEYKKHLSTLEDEIDALAKHIEEYKIIRSIPGIGEKIDAMIISEIGEIDRFNHPKKLVAFAGIDPSIFESGTFKGTLNRITKRGSSRLRQPWLCLYTFNWTITAMTNPLYPSATGLYISLIPGIQCLLHSLMGQ